VYEKIKKIGIIENKCWPYLGYSNSLNMSIYENDKCILSGENYYPIKISNYSEIIKDKLTILQEIRLNGPIQAELNLFEDFLKFKICSNYKYKYGNFIKRISIKIVGWDISTNDPYWLVKMPLDSLPDIIKISFYDSTLDSFIFPIIS
jgi:hypothetical protein